MPHADAALLGSQNPEDPPAADRGDHALAVPHGRLLRGDDHGLEAPAGSQGLGERRVFLRDRQTAGRSKNPDRDDKGYATDRRTQQTHSEEPSLQRQRPSWGGRGGKSRALRRRRKAGETYDTAWAGGASAAWVGRNGDSQLDGAPWLR